MPRQIKIYFFSLPLLVKSHRRTWGQTCRLRRASLPGPWTRVRGPWPHCSTPRSSPAAARRFLPDMHTYKVEHR